MRVDALRQADILDTQAEVSFDRLTKLAGRMFRVPVALITFVDEERQWFKSSLGFNQQETSRDVSFCAHAIIADEVLVVPDATLDARFAANPLVTGYPNIRFYAGAPLRTPEGFNIGTLCLIDTSPREFDIADRQALKDMAAIVMDEIQLRLSQKRIEESESRVRALLDSASDVITVLGKDGVISYESSSVTAVLGYQPHEVLGRSIFDFLHPDDTHFIEEALKRAVEQSSSFCAIEFRFLHRDGSWRTLESLGECRFNTPGVNGLVMSSRDVTLRRQNDERLRLLESVVVHANDAVIITDTTSLDESGPRILYVNDSFSKMTGYSMEEIIGRSPRFLQGVKTGREPLDRIRAAMEKYQPASVEVLNYRKDGSCFWVEMSIVPVADESGKFTHWISVQRDTTERRNTNRVLQQAKNQADSAREEAEEANHAKNEFLGRMSHELRTPLNAILGFGQLLEIAQLVEEDRESVEQILRGGRHLLALINDVLDITRIEAGQLSLSLEPVFLLDICNESLALIRSLSKKNNLEIHNQVSQCSVWVVADQQCVRQILLNFLSNAVKYSRHGGSVTLWCEISGESLRLCVRDEGFGIAANKQARMFTLFDRLGAEKDGIEGTGIGLALSKQLAEAMNGKVGFESEENVGSTFWVELPLALSETVR